MLAINCLVLTSHAPCHFVLDIRGVSHEEVQSLKDSLTFHFTKKINNIKFMLELI